MRAARGATQAAPGGSAHGMGGGCVNFLGHNVVIPSAGPSSAPALFPHVPHRESVVGMKTAWSRWGWGGGGAHRADLAGAGWEGRGRPCRHSGCVGGWVVRLEPLAPRCRPRGTVSHHRELVRDAGQESMPAQVSRVRVSISTASQGLRHSQAGAALGSQDELSLPLGRGVGLWCWINWLMPPTRS